MFIAALASAAAWYAAATTPPVPIRLEAVLDATPDQAWAYLGAGEEEDAWCPGATVNEGPAAALGSLLGADAGVRVLALDPDRMLSWQAGPGAGGAWGVLTLTALSPRHTRATVALFGLSGEAGDDTAEAWKAWTDSLHEAFPAPEDETERVMAIAAKLCGEWTFDTTAMGQRLAGRTKLVEQLDGHVIYAQGWLAKGSAPMVEHAHMVLFRDPGGLGVRMWSSDEHGAIADGWASAVGDDTLVTEWTQHLPGGGEQAIRVEYTVVAADLYRAKILIGAPGAPGGFVTMAEIDYRREAESK